MALSETPNCFAIRVNGVETPYEVPNVTVGGTATVNVDKDGGVTVTFGGATPAGG